MSRLPGSHSWRSANRCWDSWRGRAIGNISSNRITNIYYILRKAGGDQKARFFILSLLKYLAIMPLDHSGILGALKSDFSDFEDAVQYFAALGSQCECLITRNIDDYKKSELDVFLPIEFLRKF